jgi:hypothetical protein
MHSHIAAAGQRLDSEIAQAKRSTRDALGRGTWERLERLNNIADILIHRLEGQTIGDALAALHIAGELIVTQSTVKQLTPRSRSSSEDEASA